MWWFINVNKFTEKKSKTMDCRSTQIEANPLSGCSRHTLFCSGTLSARDRWKKPAWTNLVYLVLVPSTRNLASSVILLSSSLKKCVYRTKMFPLTRYMATLFHASDENKTLAPFSLQQVTIHEETRSVTIHQLTLHGYLRQFPCKRSVQL